jgi:hypothetical protein
MAHGIHDSSETVLWPLVNSAGSRGHQEVGIGTLENREWPTEVEVRREYRVGIHAFKKS